MSQLYCLWPLPFPLVAGVLAEASGLASVDSCEFGNGEQGECDAEGPARDWQRAFPSCELSARTTDEPGSETVRLSHQHARQGST